MATHRASLNFKTLSRWFSDEGLTKKAYLNAIASILDYGVRLLVGFVITPLLVAGLGSYGFGVWQVLGRLIGYINPVGGRSPQALKWTIANKQASADYEEKRRLVGSAVVVWALFLPFLVSIGAVLAWFAPLWLDAPEELSESVRVAAAILVASLMIVTLMDVPKSVLTGENLGYKRMGLSALLVVAGGVFMAIALHLDTGLVGIATAQLAATILTGVVFLKVARTHVHWFGIARPLRGAVRWFLGLSGWFVGWGLIMKVMRASDVVVLGILDSAELVTVFTLTKYIPETLLGLAAVVVFGVIPGLGGILGSGDLVKAARVRAEIMQFTWLLLTAAGVTILLWNGSFVGLWIASEYYAGPFQNVLIIAMTVQFVLIRNDASIIDLTLDLRQKVLLGFLSTAASIGTAGILVARFDGGVIGLCLGFIAGRLVLTFAYPWIVGRHLGISLSSQLKSVIRPAFVTLLLFAFASELTVVVTARNWLELVLSVGATLALSTWIAFYGGLSAIQRKAIVRRIRLALRSAVSG